MPHHGGHMIAPQSRNQPHGIAHDVQDEFSPATNAVEQKHTLIQRVDDVLLGVGYYTRP